MSKAVYRYMVQSKSLPSFARECEIVGDAYFYAGWNEKETVLNQEGFPEYIIFEWNRPGVPVHPLIDLR